ncbi:MAG: LysM peptidoglycan-binding domain-containing protein [Azoarcus sp.]|jgi:LysM repeat protein|nr:LysM peptidoglycan-binding domain-containing protein [Azoarcus sp.]
MSKIISSLVASIAVLVSSNVQAAPPAIADNAPDSYTVVKGDTLWGISGRFLQEPWRWPEVWQMNEAQIKNPHLIYPGQVVVLDRSGATPRLLIGKAIGNSKLEPRIYNTPIDEAVSTIPLKVIAPFLTRPLVVDSAKIENAATIVATEVSRVYLAQGDTIFAKNVAEGVDSWSIFRPAKPLVDPVSGKQLGYEVQYLGSAKVTERTSPTTLEIVDAVEEIGTGDLMLPTEGELIFSYAPHAPKETIDSRLISIYRGVAETGKLSVVALSAGKLDGLEAGHALALFRNRGTTTYKEGTKKETYVLPEKRYGTALVFRVFDHVAYALIMDTDGQASIGDAVRNP